MGLKGNRARKHVVFGIEHRWIDTSGLGGETGTAPGRESRLESQILQE